MKRTYLLDLPQERREAFVAALFGIAERLSFNVYVEWRRPRFFSLWWLKRYRVDTAGPRRVYEFLVRDESSAIALLCGETTWHFNTLAAAIAPNSSATKRATDSSAVPGAGAASATMVEAPWIGVDFVDEDPVLTVEDALRDIVSEELTKRGLTMALA